MAFSEGQIDRLRARLCAYRAQAGVNGRMRPWKAVLDDILLSDATAHHYPEDGSLPDFKEEALRRFASGVSVLSEDKLQDIYDFLLDQKYLTEDQLADGIWDYSVALSLAQVFNQKSGYHYWADLKGCYRSEVDTKRHALKGFTRSDLTFTRVDAEEVLEAGHAWFTWLYDRLPEEEFHKKYGDQIRRLKGYGFPTVNGGLIAFFKDGMTCDVEVLLCTDMENGSSDKLSWFRAAKLNLNVAVLATKPEAIFDDYAMPRFLYQSHEESPL